MSGTIYRDRVKDILLLHGGPKAGAWLVFHEGEEQVLDDRAAEAIADEIIEAIFPLGGAL